MVDEEDVKSLFEGDRLPLPPDQVQQAIRMLETADIADEHGVPFLIVYGISA